MLSEYQLDSNSDELEKWQTLKTSFMKFLASRGDGRHSRGHLALFWEFSSEIILDSPGHDGQGQSFDGTNPWDSPDMRQHHPGEHNFSNNQFSRG